MMMNHDDDHDDDDNNCEDGNKLPEQPPTPVEPQLRRSTRQKQPSFRYPSSDIVLLTDGGKPETNEEVMSHEKHMELYNAMQDEMNSLHENHTYELTELLKRKRALPKKWVYELKPREGGNPPNTNPELW